MLVVSRRIEEALMIGDDVRVVVTDIRGDKALLGVEAPRHVVLHREEVWASVQRSKPVEQPEPWDQ